MNTTQTELDHTIELYQQHVMTTYGRARVEFERGEGAYLWDSEGRRYLDFLVGIGVNGVGHCHPAVVEAIQKQAARLIHTSNLYYIAQQAEVAEILCRQAGMDKVFLCNSGTEANEAAIKICRKRGRAMRPDKTVLIVAEGSFHGRSYGALSLTAQEKYQTPFAPLVPDVRIVPWNDPQALWDAVDDRACGIFLEPIQGEMGVRPASVEFLQSARQAADEHAALLVFDEIQTGCGRTGDYFAYQGYGVIPDIISIAKAMGGGVPIGACAARGEAAEILQPGDHGTTYGGGPLACSAAAAALRVIENEDLPGNARRMGATFREGLEALRSKFGHLEVRGRGLMLAMVLAKPVAKDVAGLALEDGLIINAIGADVLRFLPPLIITQEHITEALQKLNRALESVA